MRVAVTDYTFPDLDTEAAAASVAGAGFAAFQCRTAEDVAGRPLRKPVPGSISKQGGKP